MGKSRSLLKLVAAIAVALNLGIGVGLCQAGVVSCEIRRRDRRMRGCAPYALRLKAFFMPAMVSAKRTCCDAMTGEGRIDDGIEGETCCGRRERRGSRRVLIGCDEVGGRRIVLMVPEVEETFNTKRRVVFASKS